MTKEIFKIYNEVFDQSTLRVLNKFRHEYYEEIESCISTGKEANVFRAITKKGYAAVKIFRTYTSSFDNMAEYIRGDPRFYKVSRNKHNLVRLWCRKEFRNLTKAYEIGIPVPKPYVARNNVLIMEFIGEREVPALLLKDVELTNPQTWYDTIMEYVKKLYKGGLVHADLSEFNILVYKNHPVFIDMAQSVLLEHPKSVKFLKKDVENLNNYFKHNCSVKTFDEFMEELKD